MGPWVSCVGQKASATKHFSFTFRWAIPNFTSSACAFGVSQGGHDIPDADIRRRYWRSLRRASEALRLADEAVVLDNSGLHPVRMLLLKDGGIVWQAETLPKWVQQIREAL